MDNRADALRDRVIAAVEARPHALSFSGLAKALGKTRQWGSMLKHRKRRFDLKYLDAAARYLGQTPDQLLGYDSLDSDLIRQKRGITSGRNADIHGGSTEHAQARRSTLRGDALVFVVKETEDIIARLVTLNSRVRAALDDKPIHASGHPRPARRSTDRASHRKTS